MNFKVKKTALRMISHAESSFYIVKVTEYILNITFYAPQAVKIKQIAVINNNGTKFFISNPPDLHIFKFIR